MKRRNENMKRLIEELRVRNMTSLDMSALLGFSKSGGRKYLNDLSKHELIEVVGQLEGVNSAKKSQCTFVYGLRKDEEIEARIAKMIADVDNGIVVKLSTLEKKADVLPEMQQGQLIHLMADDAPFKVRSSRMPIMRDPLVAALFGPAKTQSLEAAQ